MKVSICCVTYNHQEFIAQALDSLLMQQTNFDFKIVVGEDCSTDGTRNILKGFKEKHPEKFIMIYNPINIGVIPNFKQVVEACNSEYIAICSGDDYWTDPLKLQKQIDFLEDNPDFILCGNAFTLLTVEKKLVPDISCTQEVFDGAALAEGITINASTAVFRNFNSEILFPDWIADSPIDDWALFVYLGQYGKFRLLKDNMSVYRLSGNGMFSSLSNVQVTRSYIETILVLLKYINDSKIILSLRILLGVKYIQLLSLHHHLSDKKIKWKIIREIKYLNPIYSLKQYRYMLVYLFDILFERAGTKVILPVKKLHK